MDYTGDVADAVQTLLRTLLHRVEFVGPATSDVGVGAVDGSLVSGIEGYCVVWGANPVIGADETPIRVPGPGEAEVVREGHGELPDVEKLPGQFGTPRGYPVAVYFGKIRLAKIRIRVLQRKGKRFVEVPGHLFTPADPVTSSRSTNQYAAFFVAERRLEGLCRYQVVLGAQRTDGDTAQPMRLVWSFVTAK